MAARLSMTHNKLKTENLSGSNYFQNTMGNSKNFNNSLYDSGELNHGSNFNFPAQYQFKERNGRLKWKEIMKLDIEAIIRSNDLSPLENYLENLIFASIEECDLEQLPDPYVVKLIKIFQYIMEYLLYTQQRLENDNKTFESKYSQLVNDAYAKEEILKENKILINTLRKDKKEKEMVLHTYKCLIDEYKSGNIQSHNQNVKFEKKYFYCDLCQGKKFSTQENLDSHLNRRHTKIREDFSATQKIQEQTEKNVNLDEKFDQMKNFFESYVKNFAQESYLKIFENQKNLESKIYEIKFDKLSEVKEMESQFRNTLMDMKELYLKNSVNMVQMGNSYHGSSKENNIESNIKSIDEDKTFEKIKNETQKMSEVLTEINKEQNQKIQTLVEQISSFKNSVNQEFRDIKETTKESDEKKIEMKKEKIRKIKELEREKEILEAEEKKKQSIQITKKTEFLPIISHIESIEIKTESNKKIFQTPPKEIKFIEEKPKKKPFFNAGPLESDHEKDKEIKIAKSLYLTKEKSIELERKFSFANKNLRPDLNEENENIPMSEINADNVLKENNVPYELVNEEQKNINETKFKQNEQDEMNAPEMEEEQPEEYYRPAEFSIKNKILENLKSSQDKESSPPKRLETIGNVSEAEDILNPEEEFNNNELYFSTEMKEIPHSKEDIVQDREEIPKETIIHPDIIEVKIPKKEQHDMKDNLKQLEALKRIEDFYSKMEERDSNSIEKNDAYFYADKIISTNAKKEVLINKKVSEILDQKAKIFMNLSQDKNVSFASLNQNTNSDLLNLIDNLLDNINNNSKDRAYLQEFYSRLDSTIGLTELTTTVQNYKKNKTIMQVPSTRASKRNQTALIVNNINTDPDIDFKTKGQFLMKQNTFSGFNGLKQEYEKTPLQVEDLEDEFDHAK